MIHQQQSEYLSGRSLHVLENMGKAIAVDREGLGDVELETTHIESKPNGTEDRSFTI